MTPLRGPRLAVLAVLCVAASLARAMAAPSAPPVTRAEADAVLAAMSEAYRNEDPEAIGRLHATDDNLAVKASHDAKLAFRDRNAFRWMPRVQAEEPQPDGALELVAMIELESRILRESRPRREKRRWRVRFERRPDRGVVIVAHRPAEAGLLPASPPWLSASVSGEIRLPAPAEDPATLDLDVVLRLTNRSAEPQALVGFGLHPYSSGLVARAGGDPLPAERVEASVDAWLVTLAEPVPPGGSVDLRLSYALEQPGDLAASAIRADLVRLTTLSAWLPAVEPLRDGALPTRSHDVVVLGPEGMAASMPGLRSAAPSPGPGLVATRFVSEMPSAETPLVAVRGRVEEIRLGPQLVLDVLRADGGGDATTAISHVTTLAAFLEDRLGPSPLRRLALAESGGGGFREAPGWMALPTLAVARHDTALPEHEQVFLFVGLAMTRAWIVHRLAPTGPGANDVALGLCEHLIGAWAGAAVHRDVPVAQRDLILSYAQLDPQLDRPLLPIVEDPGTPAIFKQGKARMAFDGYELIAGPERWRDALLAWSTTAARGASIEELIGRMQGTPEADAYVEAFFRRQGACQVRVADVRLAPLPPEEARALGLDPQAWKRIEIEIANDGLGPVPVEMRIELDQALRSEILVVPELSTATLRLVGAALPPRIAIDPRRILWQSNSKDDKWPPFVRDTKDKFGQAVMGGPRRSQPVAPGGVDSRP